MEETTEKTEDKQNEKPWLFKPGESGNPNGRPKGSISITTEIKNRLEEYKTIDEKKTYLRALIDKIMKKAIDDEDVSMITKIWNYVDGMPKQDIEVTGGIDVLMKLDPKEEELLKQFIEARNK